MSMKLKRVTVFLTTHYMDEADRVAHRIAIIDHGNIVAQGTSEALKAADRHRFARARFSCLDRVNHSRRRRNFDRPVTPGRKDVGESTMSAIYILWLRELKRYIRSKAQIVASLGQPLLTLWFWVSDSGRSSRNRAMAAICSSLLRA